MDKQFIISEIQRTAEGGKALGQTRFTEQTGIKPHEWVGKYWARWGDAVTESGYSQNAWTVATADSYIFKSLLELTRKLGKFPTKSEIKLERKSNPGFPSYDPIARRYNRVDLQKKLFEYCDLRGEYADIESIIREMKTLEVAAAAPDQIEETTEPDHGYVYLVKGQNAYKIGSTRAPYRRVAEIVNQSAYGAELLHLIATDDPEGIEDYWHRRFNFKCIAGINKQSGEWFELSKDDVKVFKRRKTM